MKRNYSFQVERRVRTALGELAEAHCLTPTAYLRTLILKEHANLMKSSY